MGYPRRWDWSSHVAPPSTEPLVRCAGLSISYASPGGPSTRVVDEVSFELAEGDSLGIVGESGSGKSTLARALLGYRRTGSRFDAGSLRLGDVDLVRAGPVELGRLRGLRVAMVPQNPLSSLTHHRRVGWQVEEVLRTRGGMPGAAARARVLELFDEMDLPEPAAIARRYPHQLSGGQRQRVVIAAALACDPALLVLDEPTTALDKQTEAQVLELILRVKARRGAGLVLVSHDLNAIARTCAQVLVMKDGRVVEAGPTAQVFAQPRSDYARMLMHAAVAPVGAADTAEAVADDTALLLEARGLCFAWPAPRLSLRRAPARPTLDSVDLSVRPGEVLGVIGESGSGKTTLGLLVAGLMAPGSGDLRFDGASIATVAARRSADVRRRIQTIFQDPLSSLNPRHTVGASIERPLRRLLGLSRAEARARAADCLSELGLGEAYLERYPRQLSGGQQQRVAIARAFAVEPDLLVCDEITSALDASVQAQVLEQLVGLQRRRRTAMIVVTHDLAVVRSVAARVLVLQHGRVVESGPVGTVLNAPDHPYTRALLVASHAAQALGVSGGFLENPRSTETHDAR